MPDAGTLAAFALGALVLAAFPGPAVVYIVSQSVAHGPRAGVASAFGIATGGLVHVALATVGLSSLLASSATAYDAVKLCGAAYLCYLGLRRLLSRTAVLASEPAAPQPLSRLYRQGVVVNVLNPKTALFFVAFLPQFVDPAGGPVAVQLALLGLLFVAIAVCSDNAWALAAGRASRWLRARPKALRTERVAGGVVLIGLGVLAATARRAAA